VAVVDAAARNGQPDPAGQSDRCAEIGRTGISSAQAATGPLRCHATMVDIRGEPRSAAGSRVAVASSSTPRLALPLAWRLSSSQRHHPGRGLCPGCGDAEGFSASKDASRRNEPRSSRWPWEITRWTNPERAAHLSHGKCSRLPETKSPDNPPRPAGQARSVRGRFDDAAQQAVVTVLARTVPGVVRVHTHAHRWS
jgi:hypothetical protein